MTVQTVLVSIEQTALAELRKIGSVVEPFVLTEYQRLAAAVNATPLGTAVVNVISLLESHTLTGAQKFEQLVALVLPMAEKLFAAGGLPALRTSVEAFVRRYCEDAVADFSAVKTE